MCQAGDPPYPRRAVITDNVAVLAAADRRPPRSLRALPTVGLDDVATCGRVVVVGSDADLAAVLTRLLRADALDVEVAFVPRRRSPATRAYRLPRGLRAVRRARGAAVQRVPLIRDDTGVVLVGHAVWRGADGGLYGEAVVDDTTLFDGEVAGVRVEPTGEMPGLRASVLSARGRPRRWVTGRAAQLGTTGARVERDGVAGSRPVKRSTFYRHVTGWLLVR